MTLPLVTSSDGDRWNTRSTEVSGLDQVLTRGHTSIANLPIRIALTFPLEQLLTSDPLGIIPVPDLVPRCMLRQVRLTLVLRDNALQITFAGNLEELLTCYLYVITVQQAFTFEKF
jgi:hypothetical protein